jgi:hypothetical protein
MTPLLLLGIGVLGPGLPDWPTARAILAGHRPYQAAQIALPPPAGLPPNERRRATQPTRIGLETARQALAGLRLDTRRLASVFASSDGDMDLIDRLCTDIYCTHTAVSPTAFHNSVHNAVAGYWTIAVGSQAPSTSIAAWDGSLAAGLLESAAQTAATGAPVILIAYDFPATGALAPHRPFTAPFGCALVLGMTPTAETAALGTLRLTLETAQGEDRLPPHLDPALEQLRTGNPAARVLPLLRLIAEGNPGVLRLPYLPDLELRLTLD